MALDPIYTDAMLGTFRTMHRECLEKNIEGEKFDQLTTVMERMEAIAATANDIGALQGTLLQEDLMGQFGLLYGELLAASHTSASGNNHGFDDRALLQQNLRALEDAIRAIDDSLNASKDNIKKREGSQKFILANETIFEIDVIHRYNTIKKAIHELVDLGKSCENYPTFLRVQIEKGLDKAVEGTAVIKEVYEEDALVNEIRQFSPYHVQRSKEILNTYQELEKTASFGIPHALDIEMERYKIEHRFEPNIREWDLITERWKEIIETLAEWAASQCSRAMYVDPWSLIPVPQRPEAIRFSKHCNPGIIKEQIRLFNKNFGMSFNDIFTHETFIHYTHQKRWRYSQEYLVHLLNVVYPLCTPKALLPRHIIDADQKIFDGKRYFNPEEQPAFVAYKKWFDEKYGAGTLESLTGIEPFSTTSVAQPWNYDSFIQEIAL